ncbi:MAG: hypothetical protein HY043_18040 [Verrucomicrobia bacterium]|nr:hypothetical protein [Verrucomicrobiota bacterium]
MANALRLITALSNWAAAWAWLVSVVCTCTTQAGTVAFKIVDKEQGQSIPARLHLIDPTGKPVKPNLPSLPFWYDHFVIPGEATLDLPSGRYSLTVERGPEWSAEKTAFTLSDDGSATNIAVTMRRLVNLPREGWWPGEMHVHRPLKDVELLMRAEDLHVAQVITWWNDANPWAQTPIPASALRRFDGNRFYDLMAGEDERGGGALLYFGLPKPLAIAGAKREWPSSVQFLRDARRERGVWVDIEKPFWWDTPLWLASGQVDSVGIAHNHMHRGGVLGNEAWGRSRDVSQYPTAQGNGNYTQEIYYRALNAGLHVPPSAGSASGVLANPVGYNRAYVHVEGELTWEKWWNGLRAGQVFVSNGPLLRCRANGQLPGHVFTNAGPLRVRLEGQLDSRDPIHVVELVQNGRAAPIVLPHEFSVNESGWFLVRAITDVTNTFRFASTGPFYVELGGQAMKPTAEAVQFFLDWIAERRERLATALPDASQRTNVLKFVDEAERVWKTKLD